MTLPEDPYPAQASSENPVLSRVPPEVRRGRNQGLLPAAIAAFLLGGGAVGWLAWHGDLARVLPAHDAAPMVVSPVARSPADVTALETRLALLEDRFSRLNQQASEAASNAGKAERLLIAQSTRRAIERGLPLGYLADQLRLRFADTQPRAVETLIAFSQRPVTLDSLDARLDTLAGQLVELPRETTSWDRMRSALSGLLTIRSDATPVLRPDQRLSSVKLLLANGNIDGATATIARLPGASAASQWTADAHRFSAAQQALDVIESAAIEPAQHVGSAPITSAPQPAGDARD